MAKLLYGERELRVELPEEKLISKLIVKPFPKVNEEEVLVRESLINPIASPPLAELVEKGEKACIIVGDMTRLWVKHHVLMPFILNELNKGGISDEDILILSATGDHRKQTSQEHRQ